MDHDEGVCSEDSTKAKEQKEYATKSPSVDPQQTEEPKKPSEAESTTFPQAGHCHPTIELEQKHHEISNTNKTDPNIPKTIVPRNNDVLLGRGRPYHTFEGNLRMWRIIANHKPKYDVMHRAQRHMFAEMVLDEILEGGTRFLRRIDGGKAEGERWEEVGHAVAVNKIWHAFRSKGKKGAMQHHQDDSNREEDNEQTDDGDDAEEKKRPSKPSTLATATTTASATTPRGYIQPIQPISSAASYAAGLSHPYANTLFGAVGASAADMRAFPWPAGIGGLGGSLPGRTPLSLSPYAMQNATPMATPSLLTMLRAYGLHGTTREDIQELARLSSLADLAGHQARNPLLSDQDNLLLRLHEEELLRSQALHSYITEARQQQSKRKYGG